MTGPAGTLLVEDVGWVRIDDVGSLGRARRLAVDAATELGLPAGRIAELQLAVAEMTTNLCNHADEGSILVRRLRRGGVGWIEVVAVDAGPGMADLQRIRRDGYSTAGTLGIGFGTIERLASRSDVYSVPGRGTVLAAQFWSAEAEPQAGSLPEVTAGSAVAGITRPITGERVCGDGFAVRDCGTAVLLLLCDGLGHGPLAAAATQAAAEAFRTAPATDPAAVVEYLHGRMAHTRGAAVGVAAVDRAAGTVRFAGLGNVAGHVVAPGLRRTMVSLPGIAGHQRRTVREFGYDLPDDGGVVLHSDGLTDRWSLDTYPGLFRHAPVIVAATLLRDAGLRRDDASVAVALRPGPTVALRPGPTVALRPGPERS